MRIKQVGPLQFIIIRVRMQSQQQYLTKPLNITPGFQLKLSEILTNSPSSYKIQSDSVILSMREGTFVDVYFCDPAFTCIQNHLAIEAVTSLREIRVKYNSKQGQVVFVYKSQGAIHYYKGQLGIDQSSGIRSSFVRQEKAELLIDKNWNILQISDIYLTPKIGAHFLVTLTSGHSHLLQYNKGRSKLAISGRQNGLQQRVTGLFRSIFKPLIAPSKYNFCSTFLYPYDKGQNLYTLILLDDVLQMRYYNLEAQEPSLVDNSCEEMARWDINLGSKISPNSQIISCLFVPQLSTSNRYEINLILLCHNNSAIDYYSILIDLGNSDFKISSQILDIFRGEKPLGSNEMEEQITFNSLTDFIDMELFYNRVYIALHKEDATNKKKHMITRVDRQIIGQIMNSSVTIFGISQQLRLVKLQKSTSLQGGKNSQLDEQQPRLLLIGQSASLQFFQIDENQMESLTPLNKQTRSSNLMEIGGRIIPPIPSYDDRLNKNGIVNSRMSQKTDHIPQEAQQYLNPFSKRKIQKFITRKDFYHLFESLNSKENQFYYEVEKLNFPNAQQMAEHLLVRVMIKLFTYKQGSNNQLNMELVKQIFNQTLQPQYSLDQEEYENFLKELFIDFNIQNLRQILEIFIEKRHSSRLYEVCVETIPTFYEEVQKIFTIQNEENLNWILERMEQHIYENYLNLYQKLLMRLTQNYMEMESVQPYSAILKKSSPASSKENITYRNFSDAQLKELIDKYLYIKSLTPSSSNQNIETMKDVFTIYFKKGEKWRKFLTSMALKHKNITLFDFMLLRKAVDKEEINKFVFEYRGNSDDIQRLFINLINTQIESSGQSQNKVGGKHVDKNLSVLFWIPQSLVEPIYEYLLDNSIKIGVVFGLMHKKRSRVAKDLSSRPYIFDLFHNAKHLQEILEPIYSATNNPSIRMNIDLARLLAKANKEFVSVNELLEGKRSIEISNKLWESFKSRVEKYAKNNTQILEKIRQSFVLQ